MYSIFGRKVAGWTKQNVLNRVKSGSTKYICNTQVFPV